MTNTIDTLYQCKICLEKDELSCLISPCKCAGSIKYVHPQCMKSWRKSLQQRGREKDIYKCTLCQHSITVKQLHPYRAILNYKIIRSLCTILLLMLLLIPIGWFMKVIIQFSAYITKDPNGGIIEAWKRNQFITFLFTTIKKSILSSIFPSMTPSNHVNYAPFSICQFNQPSQQFYYSNFLKLEDYMPFYHSILSNQTLYVLFFPFSDERLWQFLLCDCQHIHLGFFLLGSVANVWYTYQILYDMFDIVFMGDDDDDDDEGDDEIEIENNHFIQNEINQHQQQLSSNITTNSPSTINMILSLCTRKIGSFAKGFLVSYCCMLVILFWIHFNLFAFVEPSTSSFSSSISSSFSSTTSSSSSSSLISTTTSILSSLSSPSSSSSSSSSILSSTSSSSSALSQLEMGLNNIELQKQIISIKNQFITELPLWTLRWVTLGVAVISVMIKIIYPWISQLTSCIDQEIVLSLPEH